MENLGKLTTALIVLFISIIINSFVFMKLWNWNIAELFDLQYLSLAESAVSVIFLSFIVGGKNKPKEEEKPFGEVLSEAIGSVIGKALFFLLIGYVASLFI